MRPKPANLTFEQAAIVPISGSAALQALRDAGRVQPGKKVLIIGAAGGCGLSRCQIAKAFGGLVPACAAPPKLVEGLPGDLARVGVTYALPVSPRSPRANEQDRSCGWAG